MNCTDYMTMPLARGSDVIKFQQDPVCTSYLDWDKSHPKVPNGIGYDPPGVYNMAGVVDWDCCGGCVLYAPAISILYFSTTPAPSCPGKTGTITSPPVSPTAIHKRGVNAMNSIEGSPEFAVYDNTTLYVFLYSHQVYISRVVIEHSLRSILLSMESCLSVTNVDGSDPIIQVPSSQSSRAVFQLCRSANSSISQMVRRLVLSIQPYQ